MSEPKADVPFRILPALGRRNSFFWQAGRDGVLRFQQCQACKYYLHPPGVLCPKCHSKDIAIVDVSGNAEVLTYSVNHQPWMPGLEPPWVLAIVGLAEQDDLRLTTNIVNCAPDDVTIGMKVQVTFEPHVDDEVWIPLFEPVGGTR